MHLEGWLSKNYYILFSNEEKQLYWEQHHLKKYLPDFDVFGLFNWDYFIINKSNKLYAIVPTVPLMEKYITVFTYINRSMLLTQDPKQKGKIKWYKNPLVFGGNANDPDNITMIKMEKHAKLIEEWNKTYYRSIASQAK
jgi:hypothetical protein